MSRLFTLLLRANVAARSGSSAAPDAGASNAAVPDTANPDACTAPAAPTPVDCAGTACAAIEIPGDPIPAKGFRGYADPSLRKDPADGTRLLTVTPGHVVPGQPLTTHGGFRTLVVDSLDAPALHGACGKLAVRASATASDLSSTGSCGYDAHAAGGLILARRRENGAPGSPVRTGVP